MKNDLQTGLREEFRKSLMETLADIEHDRWAKWQEYLHSKCVEHENGKGEWVCFPSERFRHWERQLKTPYADLSEKEKDSDRAEVERYLNIVSDWFLSRRQKELDELRAAFEGIYTEKFAHVTRDYRDVDRFRDDVLKLLSREEK